MFLKDVNGGGEAESSAPTPDGDEPLEERLREYAETMQRMEQ